MLKALRFDILRGVKANGRISLPLAEKPVRVATLLNEDAFQADHLLTHHRTVFLEDRIHDWDWRDGLFRFYSRAAEVADVVVVYELDANYQTPQRFDGMTGKPLAPATAVQAAT